MKQKFRRYRLRRWDQLHSIADRMPLWGFRGQANTDRPWRLESAIHRAARALGTRKDAIASREDWMLYQFKRRAHHYLRGHPEPTSKLEWLILMQHFGAPTRLLDFTHSIYVAAHFAYTNPGKYVSIWAINLDSLWTELVARIDQKGPWGIDDFLRESMKHAEECYAQDESKNKAGLLCVEPDLLGERPSVQQGFSVMPTVLSLSFAENIESGLKISPSDIQDAPEREWHSNVRLENTGLIEFRLDGNLRSTAWERLTDMNISDATLFPGLDGYARSLVRYI